MLKKILLKFLKRDIEQIKQNLEETIHRDAVEKLLGITKELQETHVYISKKDKFLSEVVYANVLGHGDQLNWVGIHKSKMKKE